MQWKKLLHIPKNSLASEIMQKDFFLSKTYSRNKELLATLDYFIYKKNVDNSLELAICKYGARYKFLDKFLQLSKYIKHPLCKKRSLLIKKLRATSMSIVFASSYLDSPASQAGHIFLKLDNNLSDVSSYAISFGANISDDDSVIEYAYKGIAGKYTGIFDIIEYSKKIQEYADIEQRHLFSYKLRLNKDEIETAILHLYELQGVKKPYYFMNQNCASQLLHIIQIGKQDIFLTNDFLYEISPISTITLLKEKNLLLKEQIRASLESKISFLFNKMTKQEKDIFHIKKQDIFLQKYINNNTSNLMDARIYSLRYQYLQRDINKSIYIKNYLTLLRKRSSIKIKSTVIKNNIPSILDFHKSRRLKVGYVNTNYEHSLQIGYRPFYHNMEDIEETMQNGYLEYLSSDIRISENNIILNSFIFVNTQTYTPSKEPFSNFSWIFKIAYENKQRKYLTIKHGLGKAYQIFKNFNVHLLLSYAIEINKNLNFPINIETGSIWINKFGKIGFNYTHKIYNTDNNLIIPKNKLYIFSTIKSKYNNLSYNVFYKQFQNREIGVNLNYYF